MGASLQTVDVLGHKGVWVGPQQGQHQLLGGEVFGAQSGCDLPRGIAFLDYGAAARYWGVANWLGFGCWSGLRGFRFCHCGFSRSDRHHRRDFFRHEHHGWGSADKRARFGFYLFLNDRGVNEKGKATHHFPGTPAHIQQNLQDGLVDGLLADDADHRIADSPALQRYLQAFERRAHL